METQIYAFRDYYYSVGCKFQAGDKVKDITPTLNIFKRLYAKITKSVALECVGSHYQDDFLALGGYFWMRQDLIDKYLYKCE